MKLLGKVTGDPGDGATRTVNIPAHDALKVRPSDIAGGIDYQNFLSVVNMNSQDATISIVLYNKAGVEEGGLRMT